MINIQIFSKIFCVLIFYNINLETKPFKIYYEKTIIRSSRSGLHVSL